MARSQYSFAKRKRELDRQKKKAEKAKRKEEGLTDEAEEYNPYLAMREETMEYSEALDKEEDDEEEAEPEA